MPPLVENVEASVSNHDGDYERKATATLPLHTKRVSARREVSFYPYVTVKHIRSHVDYTDEEWQESWLDLEDIRQLKRNAMVEAMLASSSNVIKYTGISLRGLENKTKEGSQLKKRIRSNAYNAVFMEMDFQQEEDYVDEDAIASVYCFYSEPCASSAHQIGKEDEIAAMDVHRGDADKDPVGEISICKRLSQLSTNDGLRIPLLL